MRIYVTTFNIKMKRCKWPNDDSSLPVSLIPHYPVPCSINSFTHLVKKNFK